jgi:hypothetical protein
MPNGARQGSSQVQFVVIGGDETVATGRDKDGCCQQEEQQRENIPPV